MNNDFQFLLYQSADEDDDELLEEVVVSKMEMTTRHGAIHNKTQKRETNFYNLDAIISVCYRVNSRRALALAQGKAGNSDE